MNPMNTRERFVNVLTGKPVDRVPFMKVFGGDNCICRTWEAEHPGIGKCIDALLQFEGGYRGWQVTPVNTGLASVPPPQYIPQADGTTLCRAGDGTVKVFHPGQDFTSHTIAWPVKTRADWNRIKKAFLDPDDPSRFPANWGECVDRYRSRDFPLQLTHGGVYGFARNMIGDESLAYAFYDDPDLVHDIMDTYTDVALAIFAKMAKGVQFDLIECWEDMASRNGSFISPQMFGEFLAPNFRKIRRFADANRIPIVLVDCDGYIEALTELMLDAGVTALYPYEVQAGNDVDRVLDRYPTVGILGGLNKNVMAASKPEIDREIEKARRLIRRGRFIPGPDHFVLSDVTFAHYRYFMERLREVVLSTPVDG